MTWWQLEEMPESHWGHRWITKSAIVLFVFPTLLLAVLHIWKLVLLALASMLPRDAAWVGWAASVGGMVLALSVAFAVCRLIWPRRGENGT